VSDCGADAACCTACCATNATPVCTTLDVHGACPLPDITVDETRLADSVFVHWQEFAEDDCALVEGCVAAPGWRRLLRFTTTTPNTGTADLVLGSPAADPDRFVFSECHQHYHYDGYIAYELLDAGGSVTATGRKQAFCLMDAEPWGGTGYPMYNCAEQGISVGWADTYDAWLDCQWLDVTDVPAGDYELRLTLDPNHTLREVSTDDDVVEVPVTLTEPGPIDASMDCTPVAYGEDRDCGWADAGTFACTPGDPITLGCEGACDGGCTGDPVLRICDTANANCDAVDAIGSNDDASCGAACSELAFTCPASGSVQALTAAWASDGVATCTVTTL
jgi:hypothetical protein